MQDTPETLRNRPERNTQQQASVIYLIRNRLNGKSYVGQTVKTLQARWAEHIRDARKGSPFLFHRAIRKYGVEVFSESLLATAADQQELAVNGNIKSLLRRGRGYKNLRYMLLKAQRMAVTKTEFVVFKKAA